MDPQAIRKRFKLDGKDIGGCDTQREPMILGLSIELCLHAECRLIYRQRFNMNTRAMNILHTSHLRCTQVKLWLFIFMLRYSLRLQYEF